MWGINHLFDAGRITSSRRAPVAISFLVIGVVLMAAAVASFVSAKTTINPLKPSRTSGLVTSGVFGFSRNPIYLGDLLDPHRGCGFAWSDCQYRIAGYVRLVHRPLSDPAGRTGVKHAVWRGVRHVLRAGSSMAITLRTRSPDHGCAWVFRNCGVCHHQTSRSGRRPARSTRL